MSALLEIEALDVDVRVQGEARPILRDVGFALEAGRTLGLVGESGSGKSMTARAIGRLLPGAAETRGRIRFDGQSVLELRGSGLRDYRSRQVAMIFQDPRAAINPVRRIGDFLTEALRINQGVRPAAARRQAVDLLARVGIEDGERRLAQYPHELSGGLLQRVMIAAAVSAKPKLILADEPTTALDVTSQAEVMRILSELQRDEGMAMIFITHDLELAGAVCDETAVMYAGSIVEVQASRTLHSEPRHPYTAALVEARPDIAREVHRLPAIAGQPTPAYSAPVGCAFAPRCRFARSQCAEPQQLVSLDGPAAVRCVRAGEIGEQLRIPEIAAGAEVRS